MHRARARGTIAILAAALALLAGDTRAQSPGASVTLTGGWSIDDDLTPGLTPSTLEPGWLAGLQTEFYPGGGALGIRLAGFYTRRALEDTGDEYDVLTANLGLTLRAFPLRSAGSLTPYLALAAGGTRYAAAGGAPVFAEGVFGADPVYRAHATAAVGFDLPVAYRTALRLEVGDRVIFPSVGESPDPDGFPTVHTPVILLGLQYGFAMPPRRRPIRRPAPPPAPVREEPVRDTVAEVAPDTVPAPQPDTAGAASPDTVPAPVQAPEAAAGQPVFTVQLQDLLGRSTARRWGERAMARGLPAWYVDIEIAGTAASRLRLGAVATEAEARQLAEAVQRVFGWSVTVERIGPDETVPTDALGRTRDFLAGS